MKLSKRERALVLAVFIVLLLPVYYKYYLTPHIEKYLSLKSKVETGSAELQRLEKAKENMTGLAKSIENHMEQLARLETVLPHSSKTDEIILDMEGLSRQTGVKLQEIVFRGTGMNEGWVEAQSKGKEYCEIIFSIKVTGSRDQVISFIRGIESFTRLFRMNNALLYRNSQVSGNTLTAELDVSAFALESDG